MHSPIYQSPCIVPFDRGELTTSLIPGTSCTIFHIKAADDAQAIRKNIKDIKPMESAANNNQANREEIQMRRAVNEDIKEHPGIGKKLPSNLNLKSLLKEAIKRGRDTAASQKALGTGKRKSMIIKKLENQLL